MSVEDTSYFACILEANTVMENQKAQSNRAQETLERRSL